MFPVGPVAKVLYAGKQEQTFCCLPIASQIAGNKTGCRQFKQTRCHSLLVVNPAWTSASVAIHAKGPGIDLDVERIEGITGVTGASTPASIYNSVQMIGSTGPGIHLR